MSEASRTVDTAADARHTLDKVAVKNTLVQLEKRHTASLYSVANYRFYLKIDILLLHRLCRRIGKTAASRKDTSEIGSVIKHALLKGGEVEVTAIKQRLKLLEGQHRINVRLNGIKLSLCLLCGTRSYKDNLSVRSGFLYVFRKNCHR